MTKDYLVFSAGHFITYDGDVCERLHGHNYRVAAEVHGPLDENHYVVDFIGLRDTLWAIVDELDHHMLLPTAHPLIRVVADDREVEATFRDRRWIFPRGDCVLLPVANTTSELLARHIAERLAGDLEKRTGKRPEKIKVELDECFGNVAVCEL
jgi:6-pyruvoyltetrahydropterin/6-carboxytetrahydropterin synthase